MCENHGNGMWEKGGGGFQKVFGDVPIEVAHCHKKNPHPIKLINAKRWLKSASI